MEFVLGFIVLIVLAVGAIFGFNFLRNTNTRETYAQVNSLETLIDKRKSGNDFRLPIFFFAFFISLVFASLLFDSSCEKIVVNKLYKDVTEKIDSIVPLALPIPTPPKIEVEPEPEIEVEPEPEVAEIIEKNKEDKKEEEKKPIEEPKLLKLPTEPGPPNPAPPSQQIDNNIYYPNDLSSQPAFDGDIKEYLQSKAYNIKPLPKYKLKGESVTVVVVFVVEKNGKISNVIIPKSFQRKVSQENLDRLKTVFENMPNWIPGKQLDEPKKVRLKIPVTLK